MMEAENINNRITARKVLLINWSRFQYVTFEMSGSTLITGVNGTGKSTILDAITFLLTGNTKFNLAARDRDRGVKAYVRGDTKSNGSARYLRSGAVVSYIAMEFQSPMEEKPLVVGVNIESVSEADPAVSKWFIFRDTQLSDIHFRNLNEKTGKITIIPRAHLLVKGVRPKSASFMNKSTGIPQLLRALGIRSDVSGYQSKLTKMMAFDPENNIDRFIQTSVLDADPVNSLGEIREYREQYVKIKQTYDELLLARKQLEVIEAASQNYEKKAEALKIHELMLIYQQLVCIRTEKDQIISQIKGLKSNKAALERRSQTLQRHLDAALDRLTRARSNEILQDVKGTIDQLKSQADSLARDIRDEETRLSAVIKLKEQIGESLSWADDSVDIPDADQEILGQIDREDMETEKKTRAFLHFIDAAKAQIRKLTARETHLRDDIEKEEEHRAELFKEKKTLDSNQIIYDRRALEARDLIQKELQKQGIHTDVFLFAELVKDIRDPKWRMAIETFLGNKRFYLIAEGRYVRDVLRIIDEKNIYWAHAVVTDRLPDALDQTRPESAAEQLIISNKAARRYANYLLGGIHLCEDRDQLHDHPLGGLMQNGMLAKSYAVTKMDMRNTRICLGKDAIEIQKRVVMRELQASEQLLRALKDRLGPVKQHAASLIGMQLDPGVYDFDAPGNLTGLRYELADIKGNIEKIQKSPDFMAAMNEQTDAQNAYDKCEQESRDHAAQIQACITGIAEAEKNLSRDEEQEHSVSIRYQEQLDRDTSLEKPMMEEYEKLTKRNGTLIGIQEKTVNNQRSDLQNIVEPALRSEQQRYLKIVGRMDEYEVLTGPAQIPFYRSEYSNLRNVKIDETRQQLETKTQQLEDAFMNDFVAELKEKMDRARSEMESINRELRETPFGADTYRFEMRPRSDRSAFFNIIKRLDDYRDSPAMMMAMEQGNTQLDHDIQEFMSVILSDEDEQEYTDYRSYFNYDMKIVSRQGQDDIESDLSRKQGSASGGEKQTPYFIILAASLMQCYPRDICCERLAFIDEAFSALSRERIEQMVKYLEENHFQVLYAAPPEKIDSIGSHIDTTVSLVTKGRYTFAVDGMKIK